jgi:hypothetical protein
MPFYEKGDVRIHYEEVGSGFPLLVIPGGGLNSTVSLWDPCRWLSAGALISDRSRRRGHQPRTRRTKHYMLDQIGTPDGH